MMQQLSGLLPVNKPTGMVSKDVSRWLVKRLGKLHIGHVGTLDPAASGVLPILLGKATRLQDQMLDLPKTYEFEITFGAETDTLDAEGKLTRELPWQHITEGMLADAIRDFVGEFEQTPPIFSAVKYKGKPLYDYARGGQADAVPLETLKRRVAVSRFDLHTFAGNKCSFSVTCSRGTYIRVLVKDVAEKVGSCGTLTRLVRTEAAGIPVDQAFDLEAIQAAIDASPGGFASLVVPIEKMDLGVPRWSARIPGATGRLRGGQQVAVELGEYVEGLEKRHDGDLPNSWSKPLMLLDEHGKALGMGTVRRHESGRVLVNMKRGL
jgi:tRNA pseudouridine55 synthase